MNTNTIVIPPGYFIRAVKQEYSNYKEALWRELFQNSLDANATVMEIQIHDQGFTFEDNGTGMDESTLINGMLTLGGSVKSEDSTGGFGQAKNLLTLCHENYEIISRDNYVRGSGISYSLEKIRGPYNGTLLKVTPVAEFNWRKDSEINNLKILLAKSDLVNKSGSRVRVNVNGQDWSSIRESAGNRITEVSGIPVPDFFRLYSKKIEYKSAMVNVRINGLYMFPIYLQGEPIKKRITVELVGNTRSYLTSNRDGLKPEYANQCAQIVERILSDSNFDRSKPRKFVFRGKAGKIKFDLIKHLVDAGIEKADEIVSALIPTTVGGTLKTGPSSAFGNPDFRTDSILDTLEREIDSLPITQRQKLDMQLIRQKIDDLTVLSARDADLEHELYIDLGDSDHTEIPKRYRPGTLSARVEKIVKFWKHGIETVHLFNLNAQETYSIGITLDSTCVARRSVENGNPVYWINPEHELFRFSKGTELAHSIIQTSAHEVTHKFVSGHNESFISKFEILHLNVLLNIKNMANWAKQAEKVKI